MSAIFCAVFVKLFNVSLAEYAPHVLLGMAVWQFLTESIQHGCNCFTQGSTYVRQRRIPLAIFPLRTVLGAGLHGLVVLAVGIAATLFFRGALEPTALVALVAALLVLFLLGWSLATISGVLNAKFQDTKYIVEIGLQILFYVTPIVYKPELAGAGSVAALVEWNPLTSVLALVRTPLIDGALPDTWHVAISAAFLAAVGGLAGLLLYKLEGTLIFSMPSRTGAMPARPAQVERSVACASG
jgi:ABC-type polysaccharide/polyol phosphate export permease